MSFVFFRVSLWIAPVRRQTKTIHEITRTKHEQTLKSVAPFDSDHLKRITRPSPIVEKPLIRNPVKIIFIIPRHLVAELVAYRFVETATFAIKRWRIDVNPADALLVSKCLRFLNQLGRDPLSLMTYVYG